MFICRSNQKLWTNGELSLRLKIRQWPGRNFPTLPESEAWGYGGCSGDKNISRTLETRSVLLFIFLNLPMLFKDTLWFGVKWNFENA